MRRLLTGVLGFCLAVFIGVKGPFANPLQAQPMPFETAPIAAQSTAIGTGGAVATVDAIATQVGINILQQGGNAVDAAVAAAAALGVVEPFSAGIGGGGFMMIYQPYLSSDSSQPATIVTLDGREEAPAAVTPDLFQDPDSVTDALIPFFPNRMSSGLAVGVPGTPLNWATAVERYGTQPLSALLQPAIALAETGFPLDETFISQVAKNQQRFSAFESTRSLYLPNGNLPMVGTTLRNPDLAKTYRLIAEQGVNAFYRGEVAGAIARTVQRPPIVAEPPFKVWPGQMTLADLDRYEVRVRPAVENTYRNHHFYGMGLPSSGGITTAQTLNLLETYDLAALPRAEALHLLIEAERLAFADRNAYLGDPEYVDVPLEGLLSKQYASNRTSALPARPPENEADYIALPGNPLTYQKDPSPSLTIPLDPAPTTDQEGLSTTHLTVVDKDGMIVSYTLTIESTGGSGMVVPGYGFILNNELTDFDAESPHPNVPEAGKRPRSSMAPTIMVTPEEEIVAFGSPGGSTIITTVLNIAVNMVDFEMDLGRAIASPRVSQRNNGITQVDQGFENTDLGKALADYGHALNATEEIGAATGIAMSSNGEMTAVAEPYRRGGGSASVLP